MSVPKPERNESGADFVFYARELAGFTVKKCVNTIPKRYTFYYGQKIAGYAIEAYAFASDANDRWPTNADQARDRLKLLLDARGRITRVISLIELADSDVHFPANVMKEWMKLATTELKLLKGTIDSDRQRFKFGE